ncbi:MAG: patatin-like phospholipase family protein [Candidatus Omnitrophica bacterium]|nr:patatin-like phospholipase family protein [Candidatus Omnitrophota bacterium]
MEEAKKVSILKDIPLFSDLSPWEIRLIEERSRLVEYKKNEIIYSQGSAADAFYCLLLGRVLVYTRGPQGEERSDLEYLHRGKYFGIISLLTGDTHSVTACAINDCLLLVIKKEDFDFILNKIPRLAINLSQTLSRRLKNKDIHQKTIFETTIISVFSSYSQAGKTVYALNLAASLSRETHKSVAILDILPEGSVHSMPQRLDVKDKVNVLNLSCQQADEIEAIRHFILKNSLGVDLFCFHYRQEDISCAKKLVAILSRLVNDYHYMILDLPCSMDREVFEILNQSDMIHILTSSDEVDLKRTHSLIERLKKSFEFPQDKIKVVINEYKFSNMTHAEISGLLAHPVFATLPKIELCKSEKLVVDDPGCEYAKAVRRIARKVGDSLVGLALGVGVAYGFCHIGVLKVIEEEKIPVDVISGSSIGSLIAALWATGRSSAEILEITKEFKEPRDVWGMIDLVFSVRGFLKGNKLYKFIKKHFGSKTFYEVRLPLKLVATDIKTKEIRILEKGLLADAVMASCSMPGVFMPFKLKEEILFDGGVITPLPVEPLFKAGIKKIIAVNVTPSREDVLRQYEKIKKEGPSTLKEAVRQDYGFGLARFLKKRLNTNILGLVFSSIEMMQSEIAKREAQFADIVLHPDTSGLSWLELHKGEEFLKRGEEETRRNLDKIWQVINE